MIFPVTVAVLLIAQFVLTVFLRASIREIGRLEKIVDYYYRAARQNDPKWAPKFDGTTSRDAGLIGFLRGSKGTR